MNATATDFQRQSRKILQCVNRGESVPVTQHGELVATIKPAAPRRVVSLEEFLQAEISNAAIVDAVQEANG